MLSASGYHAYDIPTLQVDGEKVTEGRAIANDFNDFFSNVGCNLVSKIGNQNTNLDNTWKIKSAVHSFLHQF